MCTCLHSIDRCNDCGVLVVTGLLCSSGCSSVQLCVKQLSYIYMSSMGRKGTGEGGVLDFADPSIRLRCVCVCIMFAEVTISRRAIS